MIATLLLVLPQAAPAAQELTFAPSPDDRYEKVWESSHVLQIADMRRWVGDLVRDVPMDGGMTTEQTLGAVDEIRAFEGGRPTVFRRQYTRGKRSARVIPSSTKQATTKRREKSLLRGMSAVFTWVPDEAGYGKYYDGKELEEHYLRDLRADLDLWCLLPEGPVAPGTQWSIDPAALIDLLGHGGSLPFEAVAESDSFLGRAVDSGVGGSLHEAFGGSAEGNVTVTYRGMREQEGRMLAALTVEMQVGYARDRTQDVIADTTRIEKEEGIDYRESKLTLEVTGSGELLWDVEKKRAASFQLEARERVYTTVTYRAPLDEPGVLRGQDVTMDGVLTIGVSFGPPIERRKPGKASAADEAGQSGEAQDD